MIFIAVLQKSALSEEQLSSESADLPPELKASFSRPANIPYPPDNPYSIAKAMLGKMLFFDVRLSINNDISCSTCHMPSFGWESPVAINIGTANHALQRHTKSLINIAYRKRFLWDAGVDSLVEQARIPIEGPFEMGMPLDYLVRRLSGIEGYKLRFEQAFEEGVTEENILKAIATFERSIVSGNAAFDRWIAGDPNALSAAEKRGFALFQGKAQCIKCHSGWSFTDGKLHDIGLFSNDIGAMQGDKILGFQTPSLRNISLRAPYMHDGSLDTLEKVILHYISAGLPRPSRSEHIVPLSLTAEEIDDLVQFMSALTGEDIPIAAPPLPH